MCVCVCVCVSERESDRERYIEGERVLDTFGGLLTFWRASEQHGRTTQYGRGRISYFWICFTQRLECSRHTSKYVCVCARARVCVCVWMFVKNKFKNLCFFLLESHTHTCTHAHTHADTPTHAQAWEYVPLGPFLSKNFATSISPWVVPYEVCSYQHTYPRYRSMKTHTAMCQ